MKVVLLIVASIAVACCQRPPRCKSPPMWEARESIVDPSKEVVAFAKFSYDANNMRMRRVEEVRYYAHHKTIYYDTIFLFNVGKYYQINLKTKKCVAHPLKESFRYVEVSANMTNYGEAYIGSSGVPGEGVRMTFWGGDDKWGNRVYSSWTLPSCIPVTDSYYSKKIGLVTSTFYDVTVGISDPNVFIPPKACDGL